MKCIFCDGASGASLTKEHVLPGWLRELYPRSPTDTHTHGTITWPDLWHRSYPPAADQRRRQGQASTRKVRVVCEKCNNEWLALLEKRTKPLLLALARGVRMEIGPEEQLQLATWTAKTVMTAEFLESSKVAIPASDRRSLMQCLCPPRQGWWIWIAGQCGIEWQTAMYHFSSRLNTSYADLVTPEAVNLQCTTIGVGRVLLHVISTSVPGLEFGLNRPTSSDLKPIWPISAQTITWPPQRLLDDAAIHHIKRNVERAYNVRPPMHSGAVSSS